MGTRPKIVLLGTYFNEKEFIDAALEQAKRLNADKTILCDGCFDPNFENRSTDGTREKIISFCDENENAFFFEAVRLGRIKHLFHTLLLLLRNRVNPFSRKALKALIDCFRLNKYRLNQAATFNKMAQASGLWSEGNWVMTMDCDQFYNDEMMAHLHEWMASDSYDAIVGTELTFFGSFSEFTSTYERRDHNNMPHKIKDKTFFLPTRHMYTNCEGVLSTLRDSVGEAFHCGNMYHYRLRSEERELLTYQLGDRKPPEEERTSTKRFKGKHPRIVREMFIKENA